MSPRDSASRQGELGAGGELLRAVGVGAAYFGLAKIGFALPLDALGTAGFWLGAGLSLGFLAHLPSRKWLPILSAVFVGCLLANFRHWDALPLSLAFSAMNVIEPALGAWLWRRWTRAERDVSLVRLALTLALAGCVAAAVGAALGTMSLIMAGLVDDRASTFTHLFVEDWLGILVVAPLVLSWWPRSIWTLGSRARPLRLELATLLLAVGISGYLTFWSPPSYGISLVTLFGLLALLLIGGITVGPRGATLAGLCVALLGAFGTHHGHGPFVHAGSTMIDRVTALQGYLLVAVLVGLLPAVLLGDRSRAVATLRHREREVEAIFQSLGEAVIVTDATGIVTYVNRACASLVGVARDAIVGRAFEQTAQLEATAEHEDIASVVLQRRTIVRSPEPRRLLRADGSEVWISVTGAPLVDDVGQTRGVAVILTDETDRRAHAVRLAETERRLAHVQRVRAVGDLAAGVAHDFNNLLMIIYGAADLLAEDESFEDRELVLEILAACERAKKLTAQLSVFSRDDAEEFQHLDVNVVVEELRGMLARLLRADIELSITPSSEPEPVLADRGYLEQVLLNLVLNARDAMPSGGTLELCVTHRNLVGPTADADASEFVVMEVKDTGHGMDKSTQERIFEPFFSTKPAGAGTGLGLATAQTICARHHGFLDVISEPGRGSTFRVHLPRLAQFAPTTASAARETQRGAGQQVLVVEDSADVSESIRRTLSRAGFQVTVADTPSQALELLERRHFDLLLTDVIMPQMNGRELAERALQLDPSQRVLFMTGYSAGILGQGVGSLEQHAVIRKPFTAAELTRAILAQLDPSEIRTIDK